jgi:hypothetical protein
MLTSLFYIRKESNLTAEHLPGILNQTADWGSGNVSGIIANSWRLNLKNICINKEADTVSTIN